MPIRTRDWPRITAAGSPLGSRPVCSTTPSVPIEEYLPPIRGTSSTSGLGSFAALLSGAVGVEADIRAASTAARTSPPEISTGTTMVGSTTVSSSGSTGRERVWLIRSLPWLAVR